ncbi:unnamed protein product [Adineta steineri]|uniref:NAD(P)(+)--arginine ADP-ribosyltransferase n=1 Tax=Adineta steineri TaxID=433720 RepID=A0A816BRB8_9BILA|nr:unnamed protein product [Adineta steineri]CAF1613475.1 unnamed protein product [Adineta steineri]
MSILSHPRRPVHCVGEEDKSDLFTLIWLDENCKEDHEDILRTKLILKQINNNCLFYNDLNKFRDHLVNNYFFETKTLLITSGSYVEILLKDFHDGKLSSIIIFCHEDEKYEKHLNSTHVIGICTDHNSLKALIEHFLPSLKFRLYENSRLNTILSLKTTFYDNTSTLYSYILFIEILKQASDINQASNMDQASNMNQASYMDQAKDSMINQIKNYYQNNSKQLSYIESFREKYKSTNAIEWYTLDSFVYRLINRAFRTDDSALWYTFRFYISDLCKQLEEVHREQNIKERFLVYRGQSHVPKQEFQNIISNYGGLISSNGFLSTSRSFSKAKEFIFGAQDTEQFHVVIFEIVVDTNEVKHTIFVDVAQYLPNSIEEEILFNIGTVFKIDSYEKEDEFWRIRMHVTDECIMEIRQRMESIQKKLSTININLFFGKLLIDMHQHDKAKSYFKMILQNLPERDHQDRPLTYEYLGDLEMRVKNYSNALKYFQESYELKQKKYSVDDSNMFIIYNHLGNYYKAIGNIRIAEKYYTKTLNYQNNSIINIGITKLNLATIYLLKKKYSNARQMCFDAREIFEQFQPMPYGDILVCQGTLGDIYFKEKRYDIAESFYLVAFEMGKKYLSIGDPRLIHCIYALADLYHKQKKQICPLEFCTEQLQIYQKYLSNTKHICIAQIYLKMADLSNDIYYYRKAKEIFDNNKRFDYLSTAKCLVKLAEFNENHQNIILYCQALEIYRKIYPSNHAVLIKTEKELKKLKQIKRTRQYIVAESGLDLTPLIND